MENEIREVASQALVMPLVSFMMYYKPNSIAVLLISHHMIFPSSDAIRVFKLNMY